MALRAFQSCLDRLRWVLTILYPVLLHPVSAAIPYTNSYIFASSQHNGSLVYLLQSDSTTQRTTRLLSLNVSATVDAADPKYSVLLYQTPFQDDHNAHTYVPVIDQDGILTVYSGNCHAPGADGTLWRLYPDANDIYGNGTWDEVSLSAVPGNSNSDIALQGPTFLGSGFAYAPTNSTQSSIYVFGGMCPFQNASRSSTQDWVSSAAYSQTMLLWVPQSTAGASSPYSGSTTGDRAPPVPEAGFTMTPLEATSATTPSGETLLQQTILLIGGHTQNAFLNLSQVALFSVPQNSWSIVDVDVDSPPSGFGGTSTMQGAVSIEPRSGHSAVLSPDGSQVIVFGGWVGDTTNAADPALVILELGEEYGGSGPWKWSVPSTQSSSGPMQGVSLFGHGATMLPGNVMMIAGGYYTTSMSSSSSKRSSTGLEQNSQIYFFNITSHEWITSYTNPSWESSDGHSHADSGPLATTSQRAGLGAGVGVGAAAVAAFALVTWLYNRRRRRTRRFRDRELRQLALGAERPHFWNETNMSCSFKKPMMEEVRNSATLGRHENQTYPLLSGVGYCDDGSTSPGRSQPQIQQSSSAQRPIYQSLSPYNDFRVGDSAGHIHPIDEREEEDEVGHERESLGQASGILKNGLGYSVCDAADPFDDVRPETSTHAVRSGDTPAWLEEQASKRLPSPRRGDGRASPSKSERTLSNLSESSAISGSVVTSASRSAILTRLPVNSNRPISLISNGRLSPDKLLSSSTSTHSKDTIPARQSPDSALSFIHTEAHSSSADSFTTARTTLAQLQAEAEHLLFHGSVPDEHGPSEMPSSEELRSTKRPRATDWLVGTVRRALTKSGSRKSTTTASAAAENNNNNNNNNNSYNSNKFQQASSSSFALHPRLGVESDSATAFPRRAVSASSAELFRRKQGARDWDATYLTQSPSQSSPAKRRKSTTFSRMKGYFHDYADEGAGSGAGAGTLIGDGGDGNDRNGCGREEEDWDVEVAGRSRRVQQISFTTTVPREKLRVVNASVDDEMMDDT